MKLNDIEKCTEKKEKDKLRKRTERDRKKLEMEALQTPSTSPQIAVARASRESSVFKYSSTKQRKVPPKKSWETKRSAT